MKHPDIPEGCPHFDQDENEYILNVSWTGEDLKVSGAHLNDDVYPIIGSLCYWWAMRHGNTLLASEWLDWIDRCGEYQQSITE